MTLDLKNPTSIVFWIVASSIVGMILAASDGMGLSFHSVFAYAVLTAISTLLIYIVWRVLEGDQTPNWLFMAALVAFFLRLGVGLALYRALPVYGYGEKAERAGYVYWDAYKRDSDAYARGRGDVPLVASFTDTKRSDQYGGLLFVSAGIYRYLGTEEHRPLLPVTVLAGLSSLAVILSWGVGKRLFNSSIAAGAAWIAAIYPEAVLLSASQMREPFLITAFAASLYGYMIGRDGQYGKAAIWLLVGVGLFALPISPPFVAVILVTLLFASIWESRSISPTMLVLITIGLLIALAAVFFAIQAWSGLEAIQGTPLEIIRSWLGNAVAGWRVTRVTEASVWLDTLLTELPKALHLPFLVVFGLVQPFLPAALVAPGSVLWKSIAIWRSLGWFLLLPLLIFGTTATARKLGWRHLGTYFGVFIWVSALLASYRAPSYQWDNPRYRAIFLVIQAVIGSWAWWQGREQADPWLRRISVLVGGNTLIFTYWYLGRYTALPKLAFTHNLILIGLFSVVYLAIELLVPWFQSRAIRVEESNRKEV